MHTLGWEMPRSQFAGLLAGGTWGAVLAVWTSGSSVWQLSGLSFAFVGLLLGGFFGVLGGFVAGVTLRFLRRKPLTGMSNPWGFPLVVGGLAGLSAAAATPWIRRSPSGRIER